MENHCLMGTEFSVWSDENVLKIDSSDSCTTV